MTNSELRSVGLQLGLLKSAGHPLMPPGGLKQIPTSTVLGLVSTLLGATGAGVGAVSGGAQNIYDQVSEKGLANTDALELLKSTGRGGLIGGVAGAATAPTVLAAEKYGPSVVKALRKALRAG